MIRLVLRSFAIAASILLLLATGCGGPQGSTNPADASSTAAPDQEPDAEGTGAGGTGAGAALAGGASPAEPTAGQAAAELPALELRTLSAEELDEGWISLFDGQTLFGWTANSDANWRVEEGAIRVDGGTPGLLLTTTQFDQYVLKVDFRSAPGTNSGIFLATPREPQDPSADCYELNIADADNPFPTGSLVKRQRAEGNHDSDQWQSYEVRVERGRVQVQLDGQSVLDYVDPQPLGRGHIGLQLNSGPVEFRNIKLKPLGLEPLFNGQDLSGWVEYPEMASKFSVTDQGHLHVRDGRGQLETRQQFGDFVLQLACRTNAADLNSGIFFRCIPGDVMMGYESQIHNGREDGDRRRPVDHGTGGIFRRQPARLVAADDQQWFHKTLIADGPHVAVWVNGFQVTDWVDQRAADANPRRGLRLEPGTIMIQGHDPTTDISFRDLKCRELQPRTP